jgi:TonB family protein
MTTNTRWPRAACGCVILVLSLASSSIAQVSEVDYKSLYAAAEYDKALEVVSSLDSLEAQQYKALCLLALGRQADAGTAIEVLVNSSPTFTPSAEEAPPRFVELVTKVRQKLLPTIARRAFAEGRDLYGGKQNEQALKRFSLVLTLLSDPAFTDANTRQDLETLAKGFIDLANAAAAPVKKVTTAPPPEPTPAPPAAASPAAQPPKVVAPTALVQAVPPMPIGLVSRAEMKLVLVVLIDETGKVSNVTVKESAHPVYDRIVVQAARNWRYTPATRNGVPIPSEQVVTIQVTR